MAVNGGGWTTGTDRVDERHRHSTCSTRAPSTRPATAPSRIGDTVNIDNTAAQSTTPSRLPHGWQDGPTDVVIAAPTRTPASDRVEWQLNAVPLQSSNASSFQITIGTHGEHILQHPRGRRRRQPESAWIRATSRSPSVGPADTTVFPTGWFTTPATVINVTADDNGGNGIKSIEWQLDGTTTGTALGVGSTPVNVTGDGVHKLEVRIIDNLGRVTTGTRTWSRSTRSPRSTTRPSRPAGSRSATSTCIVRGTDTHSRSRRRVAPRRRRRPQRVREQPRRPRRGQRRAHAWRPGSSTTPDRRSGWTVHTIKLDAGLPTNTTPVAPTGWRNTPYSVVLNGTDGLSGVASVNHTIQLDGEPEGDEHEGTRNVTRVDLERRRRAHRSGPASATSPATTRRGAPETIRIDTVAPTDDTVYPSAPVGNRHIVTFDPGRRPLGRRRHRMEARRRRRQDHAARPTDHRRRRAHPVRPRAGHRRQLERLGHHQITVVPRRSTRSRRPTRPSIPSAWQHVAYKVTVNANDDIDGKGVDYVQWRYGVNADRPAARRAASSRSPTTASTRSRRARSTRPATPPPGSDRRCSSRHHPAGRHDRHAGAAGRTTNTITLSATDATSGLANIEYKIDNGAPISAADGTTVTLPGRRRRTRSATARSTSPASPRAGRPRRSRSTPWRPLNTSAAAPTAWQTTSLSLPLTGTDAALRRRPRRVARVGGTIAERLDRARHDRGHADARDADRRQGRQRLDLALGERSGSIAPSRSTRRRCRPAPWRKTNYTATVSGTDATPAPACRGSSTSSTAARPSCPPRPCRSPTEGNHKLETRVDRHRRQRLRLAQRHDRHRQDRSDADRRLRPAAWRNTARHLHRHRRGRRVRPADADRRASAPASPSRSPAAPTPSRPTALPRSTSAPSTAPATRRRRTTEVKIDRTPPAASVSCAPGGGTSWVCTGTGSDALSGPSPVRVVGRRLRPDRDRRRRLVHRPEGQRRRLRDRRRRQHGASARSRSPTARRPRRRPTTPSTTPSPRADAALHDRGRAPAQGRRGLRAPARPARDLRARRPRRPSTCARSRSARARSSS